MLCQFDLFKIRGCLYRTTQLFRAGQGIARSENDKLVDTSSVMNAMYENPTPQGACPSLEPQACYLSAWSTFYVIAS